MEPLRLWYRISSISAPEGAVGASQSAQVTQRAPTPATPRKTPKKRANKLKKAKCGPLVDITSKRSWQSDTNQRPAKRRKRAPPADAAAAAHKATPATPDEDDVKLSSLLPDASNAPQTTVEQSLPVCDPEVIADQANQAEEAPDNNNKTNAIFDDARPAEFSCSTPIPTPDQAEAPGSKVKSTTWLPKAVFDLDDRDLFAKRLQKITKEEPATEEDTVKPELPDEPEAPEVSVNDAPRTPPMAQKDEPMELSPSSPLDPLRICVTPEPAAAPAAASEATSDQVHDSIGALDLSGSSKGSDCDAASPQPSPGTSTTSAVAKSGPHPFFMTPMFQKTKTQPKAQPMKKPAALNSNGTSPRMIKSPLWNLLNHSMNHGAQFEPPPSPHKTLFDFFKSNPFLFRPAVPSPAGGHHQAQKSPVSKGGTSKSKNKLPSPKSI